MCSHAARSTALRSHIKPLASLPIASSLVWSQAADGKDSAGSDQVHKSKTDIDQQGQHSHIPQGSTHACPISWLLRLRRLQKPHGNDFMFSRCSGRHVSCSYVVRLVKQIAVHFRIGHNPRFYSTHSLCRGGLTNLTLAGAEIYHIQQLARPRDPRSMYHYINFPSSQLRHRTRKAIKLRTRWCSACLVMFGLVSCVIVTQTNWYRT